MLLESDSDIPVHKCVYIYIYISIYVYIYMYCMYIHLSTHIQEHRSHCARPPEWVISRCWGPAPNRKGRCSCSIHKTVRGIPRGPAGSPGGPRRSPGRPRGVPWGSRLSPSDSRVTRGASPGRSQWVPRGPMGQKDPQGDPILSWGAISWACQDFLFPAAKRQQISK